MGNAADPCRLAHIERHRLETALHRLHGEGKVDQHGGDEEPAERKHELVPEGRVVHLSDRGISPKGHKQVVAEHGRR